MKKNITLVFLIIVSFLIINVLVFSDPIEKIIATVNGVGIALSDLEEYAKPYIDMGRIKNTKEDMKTILEIMIDEELIFQLCEENKIDISDSYINRVIEVLKKKFKTANIDTVLKVLDVPTIFILKRRLKIDTCIIKMMRKVRNGENLAFYVKNPTDDDVKNYYKNHPELYGEEEERRISHILITYSDEIGEKAKAKNLIENILKKIKDKQATFEEIAKKESNDNTTKEKGGDLGYFRKKELDEFHPLYYKKAFSMKVNDISDIIYLDSAFSIIKLTDIRTGKAKTISEVYDAIYEDLLKNNFYSAFGSYFTKFKDEATIEINY